MLCALRVETKLDVVVPENPSGRIRTVRQNQRNQFRASHDIAGNAAPKELEVTVNCRSHLLQALFGHFSHVGGDFELWCRAHSTLHSTELGAALR